MVSSEAATEQLKTLVDRSRGFPVDVEMLRDRPGQEAEDVRLGRGRG